MRAGKRIFWAGYRPSRWELWRLPARVVAWVLGWEAVTLLVGWLVTAGARVDAEDWGHLGVLALAATGHVALCWRREQTSRSRSGVHLDLTSMWFFAGLLVLPMPLVLLLAVVTRVQYWFVSRRPAHRYVFSTASICLSLLTAHALLGAVGAVVRDIPDARWAGSPALLGAVALAGLCVLVMQAVLVGGAVTLSEPAAGFRAVVGAPVDNALEALTVLGGVVTAVLLTHSPVLALAMTGFAVVGRQYTELRRLRTDAATDPLTALANRRSWTALAERALARAARAGQPVSVLVIDADHFKDVNDRFGHPAGDTALRDLAATLAAGVRPGDLLARWGGEEFVLLLPDTGPREAALVAERLRATCWARVVDVADRRGRRVRLRARSVSVGVATRPGSAGVEGLDRLVRAADTALYAAKRAGRNCVRAADVFQEPRD